MAGTVSQAAFCVAYGRLASGSARAARLSWPGALAGGSVAFALATAALDRLTLPLVPSFLMVVAALVVALRLLPRAPSERAPPRAPCRAGTSRPGWSSTTGFVLLLTGVAPGPRAQADRTPGALSAVCRDADGVRASPAGARVPPASVLRGLLLGLFAFAGFFLVLAALLERGGIGPAFAAAGAVALALQGGALWALRRGHSPRGAS